MSQFPIPRDKSRPPRTGRVRRQGRRRAPSPFRVETPSRREVSGLSLPPGRPSTVEGQEDRVAPCLPGTGRGEWTKFVTSSCAFSSLIPCLGSACRPGRPRPGPPGHPPLSPGDQKKSLGERPRDVFVLFVDSGSGASSLPCLNREGLGPCRESVRLSRWCRGRGDCGTRSTRHPLQGACTSASASSPTWRAEVGTTRPGPPRHSAGRRRCPSVSGQSFSYHFRSRFEHVRVLSAAGWTSLGAGRGVRESFPVDDYTCVGVGLCLCPRQDHCGLRVVGVGGGRERSLECLGPQGWWCRPGRTLPSLPAERGDRRGVRGLTVFRLESRVGTVKKVAVRLVLRLRCPHRGLSWTRSSLPRVGSVETSRTTVVDIAFESL